MAKNNSTPPPADYRLTKTERKILDLLAGGPPRSVPELHACLPDELSNLSAVCYHICHLRQKIRPFGEDIVTVREMGVTYYVHRRCLGNPYRG